jgi:hypothetical protein
MMTPYSYDTPEKCGDAPNSTCECHGRVHYGLAARPDNGNDIDTFQEMLLFRTRSKHSDGKSSVRCNSGEFRGANGKKRFWRGQKKQCWCEKAYTYQPHHCAEEGGDCKCKGGNVFFAHKFNPLHTSKIADFEEATSEGFAVVEANNTNSVSCSAASFEGYDPLPGYLKHCYCDSRGTAKTAADIRATKDLWRAQEAERIAKEEKARADAEAEAARLAAAEKAAEEAAARAAAEAAAKKAREEAAARAEAARLAAEAKAAEEAAAAEAKRKAEEAQAAKEAAEAAARQKEMDDAIAAAEKAANDAAAAKHAEEKVALLEAAEKAKAAAIKAEVAAALAKQKAEHDAMVAAKEAQAETERVARERAAAEAAAKEAAERAAAEAEAERTRAEEQAAMEKAHADEIAA